jgi:hypothetical protein
MVKKAGGFHPPNPGAPRRADPRAAAASEEVNRNFSPARPEPADRLFPRVPYGEPLSDARTKPMGFFNILLVMHSACCREWHRLSALLALTMFHPDARVSPFLLSNMD